MTSGKWRPFCPCLNVLSRVSIVFLQIMPEFKDGVTSIAVSDHEILAGSADGRVRRYDLRMGELYVDLIDSK